MIRLVTRGRFTHDYVKALIGAPEDREPAVRKLIEGVGGKVISFYMTTGDTDFLLISETDEAEAVIAALMASSAAGMISNVATVRLGLVRNSNQSPIGLPKQRSRTDLRVRSTDCTAALRCRNRGPVATPAGHFVATYAP